MAFGGHHSFTAAHVICMYLNGLCGGQSERPEARGLHSATSPTDHRQIAVSGAWWYYISRMNRIVTY